ncbi:Cilia- and flagella-associated protein 44, partial [Nowakowskiella sp. JEL0078]
SNAAEIDILAIKGTPSSTYAKISKSKKTKEIDPNNGDVDNENENNDQESEVESEDDMDSIDSDSNESEDENEYEEVCPSDLDSNLWNKILDLRERKLDQEDVIAEIQKAMETLKKENDALIKKEKIIDTGLKSTEADIQEFQTQKQQKLNELDVVVPLRIHQLQYLEKSSLPLDLSAALVFVNEGLFKLKSRIKELQQEKADIRKQHKELRKMHV